MNVCVGWGGGVVVVVVVGGGGGGGLIVETVQFEFSSWACAVATGGPLR